ncbi:hypothetical protein JB92DRAFT_3143919 [Gautieria morchelliformis]|nr:hypothetical protein JB92DRAFT_3143919 [Gautieria morchelliformis]
MLRMTARRPLTLHVSALSDAEYAAFTAALRELAAPAPAAAHSESAWEDVALGVREARGWLRGRYGAVLDGTVIDQILKHFSPELAPQDTLTRGQFFAVLRLIAHAQSGAPVDESLVFVQANPEPGSPQTHTPRRTGAASTKSAPPPPPPPRPSTAPENALTTATATSATTPTLPPRAAPPPPPIPQSANPFTRSLSLSMPTPRPRRVHQDAEDPPGAGAEPDIHTHASDAPVSSNPFRTRTRTQAQPAKSTPPPAPSLSSASSSSSSPSNPRQYAYAYASPPLPPRKPPAPALLPPPRHASLTTPPAPKYRVHSTPAPPVSSSAKSYSLASPALLPPPPKPPKPPQATSPLIKQSLQAAKGAQSVKEVMDGLRRERRLEVIKKSGGAERSSSGSRSRSPNGEGALYRGVSPPHSFYDVAAARIGRTASPSSFSTSSGMSDAGAQPQRAPSTTTMSTTPKMLPLHSPFAHVVTPDTPVSPGPGPDPDPEPSSPAAFPTTSPGAAPTAYSPGYSTYSPGHSPGARRTKSLHHPSPGSTHAAQTQTQTQQAQTQTQSPTHAQGPPMPPPRRRRPESVQVPPMHGRRASASVFGTPPHSAQNAAPPGPAPEPTMRDALQRTLATLRPGAGFESARVKAEGRVWPGGYVKGLAKGREGEGEGGRLVGSGGRGGSVDGDDEGDGGFGQDREWGVGEGGGEGGVERDELKMPVRPGEGWTALT